MEIALLTSSSVASFLPNVTLSLTVSENSSAFCETSATFEYKVSNVKSLMLTPSTSTSPLLASYNLEASPTIVDLPHPVAPIKAIVSPLLTLKVIFSRTSFPSP